MKRLLACVLAAASAPSTFAADLLHMPARERDALDALAIGDRIAIDGFPDGFGGHARMHFQRIDVYAQGARIVVVGRDDERELPRSTRIQLVGSNATGDMRAAIAFDRGWKHVSGAGSSPSGAFAIVAETADGTLSWRVMPEDESLPAGVVPQAMPGEDAIESGRARPLPAHGANPAATQGLRTAVVAVDTDNEFMAERFGNDTTAAANWIADLFGTMNATYQVDLDVTLQIGTTYLRTAADPYVQTGTPANQADLDEFGAYWQAHYAGIPRAFATLLSGKAASGNSASGIAWVNAFCETQAQGGSYSVNQIFTNPQAGVAFSARIVGHELGHNFGAHHTHCTNVATGGAPTGSNTIDQCYRAEAACYNGAVSCPVAGPGHPLGTLMSYCNTSGANSANCGQNVLQFHPTHVAVISDLVAQNTPACLGTGSDVIFANGFD